ncbi:unnamed protein product [Discosporangium mesarthrocarpum]
MGRLRALLLGIGVFQGAANAFVSNTCVGCRAGLLSPTHRSSISAFESRSVCRATDAGEADDSTGLVGVEEVETDGADVVVIGSGISGLCAAALLATYGKKVIVCESHTQPGGCAHGFERGGYKFDSGPSLFSGMSISPTPNPLKHVLNAIGEDVEWLTYGEQKDIDVAHRRK